MLQRYIPALLPPLDSAVGYQPLAANKIAWPRLNRCDDSTVVAMSAGSIASPANIKHGDEMEDPRDTVITAGGGSYLDGSLTVALATRDTTTAQITGLRAKIFRTFDTPVAWILNAGGGGCGGIDIRLFEARLDEGGRILDRGVQQSQEQPSANPPKKQPLGTGFTVSGGDQTQLLVEAKSCKHSYTWGLEIDYIVAGQKYTYRLGTPEEPLISLGRRDKSTKLYVGSDGFDQQPPTVKEFGSRNLQGEDSCQPA
ncbi:hypothetical protein [Amycolatopsis sp. WQ 127309]|uniref:hypothetical protein n=1 Tax=Amycolatopsis sp. WQ 127309 TaxID=2932773 RepID=UPI001FF567D1|nr:hypothetical protein [Amycolatopsis sp. WQ 127309]UOZ07909.1 hypothetical protein MUY22_06385 [Amycolatopsis sp. WQ 127309]